jgi:phage regulator Rha-like protein
LTDVKDIENYFGQYINDRSKLEKKIAEALALHHKKVEADIATIKSDFDSGDYKGSGATAADLLELVLGPVEQPSMEGLPPVSALPEFVEGFATEFYKVNNLTDPKCIAMFEGDFADVTTAIADLKSGDIKGAVASLTAWVATVQPDLQKCEAAVLPELKDIENYFGQYINDRSKLEKKVAEALALHHKKVEADIATIKSDFDSGDYKGSGATAADLLELVLGPVEQPAVFLQ